MKQKIITILLLSLIMTFMALPALANSSSWYFTMDYTYVNGADNGIFHSMTSGNMYLNGDIWAYSQDYGHTSSPNTVYVDVYESVFGPDRRVGGASATPSSTLYNEVAVYSSMGSQNAGTYYIVTYKNSDDGWNIQGNGTINTN